MMERRCVEHHADLRGEKLSVASLKHRVVPRNPLVHEVHAEFGERTRVFEEEYVARRRNEIAEGLVATTEESQEPAVTADEHISISSTASESVIGLTVSLVRSTSFPEASADWPLLERAVGKACERRRRRTFLRRGDAQQSGRSNQRRQ